MPAYVPLPGSTRALMPNSRAAGPVDASEIVSLTLRIRSQDEDSASLVKSAYELAKIPVAERKYMTHDQLEAQHGASVDDMNKVERFAQQHNLTIVHRSAGERHLVLKGRLGDCLAAFPADVRIYHHSTGTYRGRQGEIKIPDELKGVITGVFGYDTRPKHRAPNRVKRSANAGPGGDNGKAPTEFAARYKFPDQKDGVALDGAGQTIAIVELGGGYKNSDLQSYFRELGMKTPSVTAISIDHAGNDPVGDPNSADGEVMLDIEVAGAVVPDAKIAVYFAPNKGNKGFIDAISAIVHDKERKPSVVSISWGGPEDFSDAQSIQAFHELFAAAANLGITICVASGDHGTADLAGGDWDEKIHVDHPSSDDLVLSCGGTQIENNVDVVWNDNTPLSQGGWTSGGGISTVFEVPEYQKALELPKSIDTGKEGRGVPDIAMSATDYFWRADATEAALGGTSAVAPLMAALVARLNQALKQNVGFLNPVLYANADPKKGVFIDVTKGTNALPGVRGYDALPGWDACTGLGTPVGVKLLNALQGAPALVAAAE